MLKAMTIFQSRASAGLFVSLLLAVILSACGGNGEVGGGAFSGEGSPTLGITSIPRSSPTSKQPSLFSYFFGGALRFISGKEAVAARDCSPSVFAHRFSLNDGTIYVLEAVAIVDEVEFEIDNTVDSNNAPEFGPFAIDLTDTDEKIPNTIQLTVPAGDYDRMKIKIKRFDDDVLKQPVNVKAGDLPALQTKIGFDAENKSRPSIWIKGVIEETAGPRCSDFEFITDLRSTINLPFTRTIDPTGVDTVLLFNFEGAFKNSSAAALTGELRLHSTEKPLADGVLDGRLKDPLLGTPEATLIAEKISENLEVFTQTKGSFAGDPS